MIKGLKNKLTGQIGEHLVTAELGRMGITATPFSGNVPDIDILAHANGITSHIQAKAINPNSSWQLDVRKFLNVVKTPKGQKVLGINKSLDREITCVFVALGEKLGDDRFYIFKWGWLQDYWLVHYTGRKPPKNIDSFHCAVWERHIAAHLNNWALISEKFKIAKPV
jgi:hypothetical protein